MNSNKNQPLTDKSIDLLKDQATDVTKIEGGGSSTNSDGLGLDPLNPNLNSGAASDSMNGSNDPSGTIVHSSTG